MATKGLLNWSTTAATNATADSQAQFAEGQAPSSLNDGIRGLMASMALYRNDISGSLTTGGTSTAYTVTANQDIGSLAAMDKQVITIVPHVTNGADPTLAVSGLTAKSIRTETGVSVASGVMIAGTPYQLVYFSSAGEFILMNFVSNPYIIPVGALLPYCGTSAPNSNFVLPYGQAVSRTTYSVYFSLVGTTFGVGDGSTTFNILDVRGRVIAGLDNMGGTSANRLTGAITSFNGDVFGSAGGTETITLDTTMIPSHMHTGTTASNGAHTHTVAVGATFTGTGFSIAGGSNVSFPTNTTSSDGAHTHTFTSDGTGGGGAHDNVQPTIILPYILRII